MTISPLAGKPAPKELLIDPARLEREFFERRPDLDDPGQLVSFGTSGHRGSPLHGSFTEAHILAITQAICDYRRAHATDGPLYMGKDTHALSGSAQRTALEVLAANDVPTVIQRDDGFTPMPAVSHAILVHNRSRSDRLADGIVITPSHNPPEDGGFKYNPTNGGPADTDVTQWIEGRANELLRDRNAAVRRVAFAAAIAAATTRQEDLVLPYVNDLRDVVRERKPRGGLGVDQFGVAVRGCAGDDPLQDLLNLGNDARMNLPGRAEGNWRWRCTEDMLTPAAFQWLRDLTKTSNRAFRSAMSGLEAR